MPVEPPFTWADAGAYTCLMAWCLTPVWLWGSAGAWLGAAMMVAGWGLLASLLVIATRDEAIAPGGPMEVRHDG